jgi:eukaryotic-like serine/threonine-protein kinase
MARGDVNRNLLFGLFALHNGLIDQSALVAAFHRWVRDKNQSLADYLIDHGDLEKDCKTAVEALVALHQKDDGQSLARGVVATLSRHGHVRAELEQSLDPDAQAAVSLLSAGVFPEHDRDPDATAECRDATMSYRPEGAAPSGQRFRILRFHAEGGLGAVYLAHDEELNRDVALKRIKGEPPYDPDSRARFVREAEITGRLEHPGVVPVYGLDQLEDGRPEYAMRFIEGESLKTAITRHHAGGHVAARDQESQALALPNLVRRFLDVCNAVSYAHNRGIVHRDIKPSNIMLGPYGETLVVDWGLAKPIGRPTEAVDQTEPTLRPSSRSGGGSPTIGPIGTPHYMSPEQASAAHDLVSFSSDIYSLGATFYCLLTGKAPIQVTGEDTAAVLAKVRAGDFRRPRELKATVSRALEAVCLKAMALKPEDRYSTARALGQDIERWLADAPVSVYREPFSVRVGRWVRRHKPLVTAAAVLFVCAVIALCVDVVRVGRERAVAEDNFLMAREAVNRVLTETAEGRLAAVPQAEELRLRVAKDALEFNERFLRQRPLDPSVLREAALTYRKVANIERMLNLPKDAVKAYGQAISLGEKLLSQFHGDAMDQLNLALTLADSGELLRTEGELGEAERTCRRAVAIADRLVEKNPGDANCHLARGTGLLYLAQVQIDARQTDLACRSAAVAVADFRGMPGNPRDGARNALLLSLALDDWGQALRRSGHPKAAEERIVESIAISSAVLDHLGKNAQQGQNNTAGLLPNTQYAHAQGELELGLLLASDQERRGQAGDHFKRAVEELSGLAQAFPRVPIYKALLGVATRGQEGNRSKEDGAMP